LGRKKMNPVLVSVVLSLVLTFPIPLALAGDAPETGALKLTSPVFENNGTLPPRYTCDGENINPPLTIKNVPRGAKSLALILDDQDAPRGSYVHWIVWNIDPETKDIKEDSVPGDAVEGTNDFKRRNYGGPCPPTRAHRYVFKLYALDIRLNLETRSTKAVLEKAMKGHILAQAQLLTSYKKVGK
jgi:Raf kinase inhibitor-like YbhB/YbcL family protein